MFLSNSYCSSTVSAYCCCKAVGFRLPYWKCLAYAVYLKLTSASDNKFTENVRYLLCMWYRSGYEV